MAGTSTVSIPLKTITNYIRDFHPHPFDRQVLSTSSFVEEEILQSIKMYSEINEIGKELLREKGHADLQNSFLKLRAFINQSVSFYQAAEKMHYRASPLLYYYSFLNAAKAAIYANNPSASLDNIHHGLSVSQYSSHLNRNRLLFKGQGVYPLLSKQTRSFTPPAKTIVRISDLFGYIVDIHYECVLLKIGRVKSSNCNYATVNFAGEAGYRGVVILERRDAYFMTDINAVLRKHFQEIDIDKLTAQNVFTMDAFVKRHHSFWETRQLYPILANGGCDAGAIVKDVALHLKERISYIPLNNKSLFRLNMNLRCPKFVKMDELLAIYCVVYFLGSCVRYRPEILEQMLSKKEAWIIEAFMRTAPVTFLRHIRNLLDGRYIAMAGR